MSRIPLETIKPVNKDDISKSPLNKQIVLQNVFNTPDSALVAQLKGRQVTILQMPKPPIIVPSEQSTQPPTED